MDFLHRNANGQPQPARPANTTAAPSGGESNDKGKKAFVHDPRWLRISFTVLLFSLTVLAIAIAFLFYFGKPTESSYVDDKKYQAVFLTNGQVYFGKINKVTNSYVDLQQIYYLNSQQQPEAANKTATQNATSFSLVKLGCELHGPVDQMVINRDQVSFWENLTTNGKVAKAIEQWVAQNPNGQNCDAATSNNTNTTTQPNGTNNTQNKQQ